MLENKSCVYGEYTIVQEDGKFVARDSHWNIVAKAESVDDVIMMIVEM